MFESSSLIFLWMTQEVIALEMESPLPRAESANTEMLTWEWPRQSKGPGFLSAAVIKHPGRK